MIPLIGGDDRQTKWESMGTKRGKKDLDNSEMTDASTQTKYIWTSFGKTKP